LLRGAALPALRMETYSGLKMDKIGFVGQIKERSTLAGKEREAVVTIMA